MSSVQPVEIKILRGLIRQNCNNCQKMTAAVVKKVKGTAHVFDGIVIAGPSVSVQPNATARGPVWKLPPANFQNQVQTSLEGNLVGNVYDPKPAYSHPPYLPRYTTTSVNRLKSWRSFFLMESETLVEPGYGDVSKENRDRKGKPSIERGGYRQGWKQGPWKRNEGC